MQTQIDLSSIRHEPLRLEDYFGLWAVEETRFLQMFERVSQIDLGRHVRMNLEIEGGHETEISSADPADPHSRAAGGGPAGSSAAENEKTIAVIEVNGTLMKRGSSLSASSSLIRLRQQVRAARQDSAVSGILFRFDTPGGTTSGTADFAKEIAAAATEKPCYAFVEDLCASAGYWAASQCNRIFANDATAMIGSIGTFIGLYDYSANAAMNGVKAVVIKTGKFKAAGFPGAEITAEQQAHFQALVDATQFQFTAAIAAGRKMPAEKVATMADGRVHLAGAALTLGLIDGIQSFDATLAQLQDLAAAAKPFSQKSSKGRIQAMSESNTQTVVAAPAAPAAATIAELKAGCPGASAEFLCKQLEKSATLAQAQQDYMTLQSAENARLQKELADANAKADAAASQKPALGVDALGSGTVAAKDPSGDPIAEWNEKVEATMSARKIGRQAAQGIVGKQHPDLRLAFVEAYNLAHPRHAAK